VTSRPVAQYETQENIARGFHHGAEMPANRYIP
jgi:hypothetical protein